MMVGILEQGGRVGDFAADFGRWAIAVAVLGVAAICFARGSFAFQREPVPASWPFQTVLIYLSAVSLALAGVLLLRRSSAWRGGAMLAGLMALWVIALHVSRVLAGAEAAWLGAAECLAVGAAGAILAASKPSAAGAARSELLKAVRLAFALCVLAFGFAHFKYA
jgi:hypothetical protein